MMAKKLLSPMKLAVALLPFLAAAAAAAKEVLDCDQILASTKTVLLARKMPALQKSRAALQVRPGH